MATMDEIHMGLISKAGRIWPGYVSPAGKTIKVVRGEVLKPGMKPRGGDAMPNGRGGGHIRIFRGAKDPSGALLRHEMAHLKPRRNPVRFQERRADHFRSGSEEGRADYMAHGKQTPGKYPGNKEFTAGYNHVQAKMHAAHQKKAKQQRVRARQDRS